MAKSNKMDLVELDVRVVECRRHLPSGWGVYEVEVYNSSDRPKDDPFYVGKVDNVWITGEFDRRFHYGEEFYMYGTPFEHPTYGFQYKIKFVENKYDTPDRVRAFLKTMVVDSIAEQLIEKYGGDVLQRIVDNEVDYTDIKGMGDYRFNAMREKVIENKYMKEMIISLSEYGITPNQMKQISKTFGADAISKIKENPYVLCQVHGIGFMKADEVAKRMGFDMNSEQRIDEAIKYVIEEQQKSGNCWVDKRKLIRECSDLTELDKKLLNGRLPDTSQIHIDGDKVTLERTYNAEVFITEKLVEMNRTKDPLMPEDQVDKFIADFMPRVIDKHGFTPTEQQAQLFHNFFKSRVNYLVGYAGCGKSAMQKLLLDLAHELKMTVLLLAPTGKAAKVLYEYTGHDAFTIHRRLRVVDGIEDVVQVWDDLIIVDESSMADVYIIQKLLRAIKNPHTRILFIGDDFQIPSVGVGNFLHDSIVHGDNMFHITMLTQVFRQAEGGLLDAVTKIRLGEKFIEDDFIGEKEFGTDLVIRSVQQKWMEKGYMYYFNKAIKQYDIEDIILLTPTKKGNLGTISINNKIQETINPASPDKKEIKHGMYTTFRVGDRIINTKNTYNVRDVDFVPENLLPNESEAEYEGQGLVDVVNGDMGYIYDIDFEKKAIIIEYDFAKVEVLFQNLDAISHAWALTIHKSQGSGFKCVIVILDKSHRWQLNANLMYTAWTRAREMCYVLCQADVINSSIKKVESNNRNTFMPELLQQAS